MNLNTTITVAGAKGGVGKTTTSINIGAAAGADGQRTVVVELDLAMANVTDFLSLSCEDSGPTLHDVLAGDAAVQDAVYRVNENFFVTPSGTDLDGYADVDLDKLPAILDTLQTAFDLVVVDTGAGISRATVEPIRHADATVLVSTPRVAAVRDTDKTKQLAQRVETPVCGLVLTKSGTGESPGPDRIAEFLDVDLLGHVPDDEAVPSSQDQGAPVIESEPDSEAASMYRTVAGNLLFRLDTGTHRDDETVEDSESIGGDNTMSSSAAAARAGAKQVNTDGGRAKIDGNSPMAAIKKREGVTVGPTKPEYPPRESNGDSLTVRSPEKDSREEDRAMSSTARTDETEAGDSAGETASDSVKPAIIAVEEETATSSVETDSARKLAADSTDDSAASTDANPQPSQASDDRARAASESPETDGDASTSDENESTTAGESSILSRFLNVLR